MAKKNYYDEDFKRTLVELYHNGKTQASLIKEYGVSQTALSRWIKQYSTVETSNGEILTAKQIQELQKRNAQLEEENLILKKAIHIYADYDKRIGAYKIAYILGRDYGICISVGRVYRLMRSM